MVRYAAKTEVSATNSRGEIERIISRYGADQFFYGWDGSDAVIGFRISGKMVRFKLALPDKNSTEFTRSPGRRQVRSVEASEKAFEQATRQRWRALALVVKAKLEAIESGISTIEQEFLAWIVLPNNLTVSEFIAPQIEEAYQSGKMPGLLSFSGAKGGK
jgi:hypothetical protein